MQARHARNDVDARRGRFHASDRNAGKGKLVAVIKKGGLLVFQKVLIFFFHTDVLYGRNKKKVKVGAFALFLRIESSKVGNL